MQFENTKWAKLAELDGLRRDRGAALLDKGKVPPNLQDMIRQTECEISALDEAIGEEARRGRVATEQASKEARAGLLDALKVKEAARVVAIEQAQSAAAALAAAMKDALSISADIARTCVDADEQSPLCFSAHEAERRLAGWLVTALATINGKHRFGSLSWSFAADVAFARDAGKTWHESETEMGARALDPIHSIPKRKPNDCSRNRRTTASRSAAVAHNPADRSGERHRRQQRLRP
jgi:hypothetical protein